MDAITPEKRKRRPTAKQIKAVKATLENLGTDKPKSQGQILAESGYAPAIVKNPQMVTESKGFKDLFLEGITDLDLVGKHKNLLNSTKLEHMTFPLGPKEESSEEMEGGLGDEFKERTTLTDDEIEGLLAGVNCVVQRVVHGDHARHVYFWAQDSRALKDGLDMAYKLKGFYAPEKSVNLNVIKDISSDHTFDIDKMAEEIAARLKEEKINEPTNKGAASNS